MVYVRRVDKQPLTLIVSGRLWRNGLVMEDLETRSYWSHITGEGMTGKFKGSCLATVPVVQTTWSGWHRTHPDTKLWKKSRDVRSSAYEAYFKNPNRYGLFRTEWLTDRMPGKALVHGITAGAHALAVPDKKIRKGERLEPLRVTAAFWFAWSTFYPNTGIAP